MASFSQSHPRKKRAKRAEIKEVLFDDEARRDFLTGFRKRKLQRTEEKKKKKAEKEKRERIEARREHRKILADKAVENAAQVEAAYGGKLQGHDEAANSWLAVSRKDKGKDKEEEFESEEQLATVTIVEDFDLNQLIQGPPPQAYISNTTASDKPLNRVLPVRSSKRPSTTKTQAPKKIHYETKAARLAGRKKQKSSKLERAARTGVKHSTKTRAKGGKKR